MNGTDYTKLAVQILGKRYPADIIHLTKIVNFDIDDKKISVLFQINSKPKKGKNILAEPENISSQNFLDCLYQLSFVLIGLLIKNKQSIFKKINWCKFTKHLIESKIVFCYKCEKLPREIPCDSPFELNLQLLNYEIKNLNFACHLALSGPIEGSYELVLPIIY